MSEKSKTKIDFDALAELSKLEFNDEEKVQMETELGCFVKFLGLVGQVEACEACEEIVAIKNALRSDEVVSQMFTVEEMLSNAKTKSEGYITVPRVVGE